MDNGSTDNRYFEGGAYRDLDDSKLDYEGFLSPAVLHRYAEYMHKNRKQSDGNMRDSDNWQAGIPKDVYMKSMWRHFMDVWTIHREAVANGDLSDTPEELQEALCALAFNVFGYLFEELKDEGKPTIEVHVNALDDPRAMAKMVLDELLNQQRQRKGFG